MLASFAWHGQQQTFCGLARPVRRQNSDPAGLWCVLLLSGWSDPMNLLATLALAFSMSADAFAAALGKGAALDKPRLTEAVRAGVIFGTIEAITPVVGWGAGMTASRFIGPSIIGLHL
jgi:Putative manganese efflux pump